MSKKINIEDIVVVGDNIIVEPYEPETDGYVASATNDDKPEYGKVIICGEQDKYKIGTIVLFGKYSTATININAKKYYMLKSEDIKAYVK